MILIRPVKPKMNYRVLSKYINFPLRCSYYATVITVGIITLSLLISLLKLHMWFHSLKTYWSGTFSHVKYLIHLLNDLVQALKLWNTGIWNICLIGELEDSYMKIDFTHEIFITRIELKHFRIWNTIVICEKTYEIFIRVVAILWHNMRVLRCHVTPLCIIPVYLVPYNPLFLYRKKAITV